MDEEIALEEPLAEAKAVKHKQICSVCVLDVLKSHTLLQLLIRVHRCPPRESTTLLHQVQEVTSQMMTTTLIFDSFVFFISYFV